jgi:hypothetical protein
MQRWPQAAGAKAPGPVTMPPRAGDDTNRGGDHARFANVVLPHLDDAYDLGRRLAGSSADAQDIVPDACFDEVQRTLTRNEIKMARQRAADGAALRTLYPRHAVSLSVAQTRGNLTARCGPAYRCVQHPADQYRRRNV